MALKLKRFTKQAVLENARRIGFRPGTIIDVGFAFGTEGLFDVFGETRNIIIEPIAEMEPLMQRFCNEHPGSSYILAAASENVGRLKMVVRKGVTGSSFHTKFKKDDAEYRKVDTIPLDNVVEQYKPPKPYLLKLDVEGHELHVLRGATRCLEGTEMVVMEIGTWADDHPKGKPSMMDLFRFMEDSGFVFYDFAEPAYRPIDGALYMFDAVFVKADSILRAERRHKSPEQALEARLHKEHRIEEVIHSLEGEQKDGENAGVA